MKVHWLQHVPFEGLGAMESWLCKHSLSLTTTRLFANDVLPPVDSFDMLIVMGGPMGVHGDEQYPWLISVSGTILGYIAICFGYTIEFGGRDAFTDEFFIEESARGRGICSAVLEAVKSKAARYGVHFLHLEVAADNARAKHIY